MGFYFCEKCGKRVTEADLAKGQGRDKQAKGVHCASCAEGTLTMAFEAISQEELRAEQDRRLGTRNATSTSLATCKAPPRRALARKNTSSSGTTATLAGGAFLLVLCAVGGMVLFNQEEPVRTSTSDDDPKVVAVGPSTKSPSVPFVATPNSASQQLEEIEAKITEDLTAYTEVRDMLDQFLKSYPNLPEAQRAMTLQSEVETNYTRLAEEALKEALAAVEASATSGQFDEAISKFRVIETRFSAGTWFESKGKQVVKESLADIEKQREAWALKNASAELAKARDELQAGRFDDASELIANRMRWPTELRTKADILATEIQRKRDEAAAAKKRAGEGEAMLAEFDRLLIAGEYVKARNYAKSKGTAGGEYGEMLRNGERLAGRMAGESAAVMKGACTRLGKKVQLRLTNGTIEGILKAATHEGMTVATTYSINNQEREKDYDLKWKALHAEQWQTFARLGGLEIKPSETAAASIYRALGSDDLAAARELLGAAGDHPLGAHLAEIVDLREKQMAYTLAMKLAKKQVKEKRWKAAISQFQKALEVKQGDKEASRLLAEARRRSEPAPTLTLDLGGGVMMEFVYIRPGVFTMGGNGDAKWHWVASEKPKHEVAITKGFYLGKYEVTQAQYEAVMGTNPSKWKEANRPVERVTWTEAAEFCLKASGKTRQTMRLPTEAEWEYACRAGTNTRWSYGSDAAKLGECAWHSGNSGGTTHPVGQKKPNVWGLYDMYGNTFEWVADWYGAGYYALSPRNDPTGPTKGACRLQRGGSWIHDSSYSCTSASRGYRSPNKRASFWGFRAAVSPNLAGAEGAPPK